MTLDRLDRVLLLTELGIVLVILGMLIYLAWIWFR